MSGQYSTCGTRVLEAWLLRASLLWCSDAQQGMKKQKAAFLGVPC